MNGHFVIALGTAQCGFLSRYLKVGRTYQAESRL